MSDKILVLNGRTYAKALEGLGEMVFDERKFTSNPDQFKLVQFTGGEDVSPELYGDTSPKNMCYNSTYRDKVEKNIFDMAIENGIKMTGICRGSQFLNVMSGGRMLHHVTNHGGTTHNMETNNGIVVDVNPSHHQMSIVGPGGIVLGWASPRQSDVYIGRNDEPEEAPEKETEAIFYPGTRCIGVQYHPEWLDTGSEGYVYYKKLVSDFLEMTIEQFSEAYTVESKLLRSHSAGR